MILYWLLAAVIGSSGAALSWGGAVLLNAGGSAYYGPAGILLLATAYGLIRHARWSLCTYSAVVFASIAWALWESGLNVWALLPRVGLLWAIGTLLMLPAVRRRLTGWPNLPPRLECIAATSITLIPIVILVATAFVGVQLGHDPIPSGQFPHVVPTSAMGTEADWPNYGGTPFGSRYSELTSIGPDNVKRLKVAWTYEFVDPERDGLEVTPLKIHDSIYACNSSNVIVSLDAETGQQRWLFDPHVDKTGLFFGLCRGVAYYKVPDARGVCAERIFTNTIDARLIAIDARTGHRCESFGRHGEVSLLDDLGATPKGYYVPTSAPTLARGRLVVNSAVLDNQYVGEPSGVVRAFDAVTGQLSWAYDIGAPDRIAAPSVGQIYTLATPNSWTPLTYDDQAGLVYVPMGSPTPDYFGALRRPMDEEIGNALVALDVETGRRRWLFQAVHHDLWDYDLASPAVLFDIPGPHGVVHALALPSKRGETFLIDRITGDPLDPIVERRVSTRGGLPGERISPTQPFPTSMPSLAGERLTEAMMWGLTPLDQLWCRIRFRQARYDGQMTPPGLTPSITYPGYLGGMDWGGVAVDGSRGIMIAVTNQVANYIQMMTRSQADAAGAKAIGRGVAPNPDIAPMEGTPYAGTDPPFLSPLDVPCQQPPWSRLSAVDLRSKRILWSRPLGTGRDSGPFGLPSRLPFTLGVPSIGASLVTASGLTFVGASTDRTFRAFDTMTGRLLWESPIPASANSGPITYRTGTGRQIVLVTAGGHHILRAPADGKLIAYALSDP